MNITDAVYPEKISGIRDYFGSVFSGGLTYTQSPGNNPMYFFGDVKVITLDFDIHAGSTGQYNIFTFPNKWSLKLDCTLNYSGGGYYISCNVNWYDETGEYQEAVSSFAITLSELPSALAEGIPLKFVFFTEYGVNPVENVSHPVKFGFKVATFTPLIHAYTSSLIVADGETSALDIINQARSETGQSNLQFFFHDVFYFTDSDDFDNWLHARGEEFPGSVIGEQEPAGGDDTSGTGGGNGNYDDSSDPIDFPSLPTGGALTSGMIKGFVISSATLVALQNKLWNMNFFDITTQFQKLVTQPLDCLISLHCLPVTPANSEQLTRIKLGSFDTEVDSILITNQYLEVDGGQFTLGEYWGSALDYSPYTKAEIYIPFCGIRQIKIDDIQNVTMHLKYHVDVLTGDLVAFLKCGQSVMYQWTGSCISHIPCTSYGNERLIKGGMTAVGSIGVGLVSGNAAAAAGGVISAATNTVMQKDTVQRSGDMTGSNGLLADFNAYLILHRPKQSLAKNYNKFKGYPSNITMKLSDLKGYTEVEHIHLNGIAGATDSELNEISDLLKSGVII